MLNYSKDYLLFLTVVRIELAMSRWFHFEALSNLEKLSALFTIGLLQNLF